MWSHTIGSHTIGSHTIVFAWFACLRLSWLPFFFLSHQINAVFQPTAENIGIISLKKICFYPAPHASWLREHSWSRTLSSPQRFRSFPRISHTIGIPIRCTLPSLRKSWLSFRWDFGQWEIWRGDNKISPLCIKVRLANPSFSCSCAPRIYPGFVTEITTLTAHQMATRHHTVESTTQSHENEMPGLTQVPTSVTLSAEQFERLYLSPMMHRQSSFTKSLGNPTPLYVFTNSNGIFESRNWYGSM